MRTWWPNRGLSSDGEQGPWPPGAPGVLEHCRPEMSKLPKLQRRVARATKCGQGDRGTAYRRKGVYREPLLHLQPARGCERSALGRAGALGIENSLHWVLDIALREDESRVRKGYGPENLGTMRHLALNMIRRETSSKGGVKARRPRAGWDEAYLLKVLSL